MPHNLADPGDRSPFQHCPLPLPCPRRHYATVRLLSSARRCSRALTVVAGLGQTKAMAKLAPDAEQREPLAGLVERVTFHNADTGFAVLRVKVRGHRDLVTVLGSAAEVHAGEHIEASGRWERHRDHGCHGPGNPTQVLLYE